MHGLAAINVLSRHGIEQHPLLRPPLAVHGRQLEIRRCAASSDHDLCDEDGIIIAEHWDADEHWDGSQQKSASSGRPGTATQHADALETVSGLAAAGLHAGSITGARLQQEPTGPAGADALAAIILDKVNKVQDLQLHSC